MPISELKNCPFCGSKANLFHSGAAYWGTCTNEECECETPGRTDPEEAAWIWNRRAAQTIPASPSDAERHERAVPDGWQLVPEELTEEMREALMYVRMELGSTLRDNAEEIYSTLLSAAPPPPAAVQEMVAVKAHPADQIIGQIEGLFPDWRNYRDIVDCIECTLHRMRSEDAHHG